MDKYTNLLIKLKSLRLSPKSTLPFTGGFSSDEDESYDSGYKKGFRDGIRLFRKTILDGEGIPTEEDLMKFVPPPKEKRTKRYEYCEDHYGFDEFPH